MKQLKKFGFIFMIFMLSTFLFIPPFAWADEDHENEDHEYEYEDHEYEDEDHEYEDEDHEYEDEDHEYEYEDHEYEDDDYERYEDEEYEREEYQERSYFNQKATETVQKNETWDTWSRSSKNNLSYAQLPFLKERKAVIKTENKSIEANVIPYQGQIYVPLQEMADLLGAEFYHYKNINAAEVILNDNHLIVKEGSKVIYENMKKTPMPQPTLSQNEVLYVPISVIANGLGYDVDWNNQEGFLLKMGVDEIAQ